MRPFRISESRAATLHSGKIVYHLSFIALQNPAANAAPRGRKSYAVGHSPQRWGGHVSRFLWTHPHPSWEVEAHSLQASACAHGPLYVCHYLHTGAIIPTLQVNSNSAWARAGMGGGVGSLPTFTALRTALSNVGSERLSLSTSTEQYPLA